MTTRTATISRKTKETDIHLTLIVDANVNNNVNATVNTNVNNNINTGNGFMDHMLTLFARHGLFTLSVDCKGDTHVDFHHSAEDIGICLGQAVKQALGDCRGIRRYGTAYVPMDESLARVCLDIAGRPNLSYNVRLTDRLINNFDCDLSEDFFKAFCDHSGATIHVDLIRGRNSHHSLEAVFKAFGRALSEACEIDGRAGAAESVPSSKGVI